VVGSKKEGGENQEGQTSRGSGTAPVGAPKHHTAGTAIKRDQVIGERETGELHAVTQKTALKKKREQNAGRTVVRQKGRRLMGLLIFAVRVIGKEKR